MKPFDSEASRRRDAVQRTANGVFLAWQKRTDLVKQEAAAASAALDAKTARLKALRLAKEKEDAEAAAAAPPAPARRAPRQS